MRRGTIRRPATRPNRLLATSPSGRASRWRPDRRSGSVPGFGPQVPKTPPRRKARTNFSMFELRNISKSFGRQEALHQTDLLIPSGQTTVLSGPSCCGKSTLLRLLLGLTAPDTGVVLFEGAPVTPASALPLRRRLGYVIQDGGLFPHLTAHGNITLMARY